MKTKKAGSVKKKHSSLVAIAIFFGAIAVVGGYFYYEKISIQHNIPQWVVSGPFAIDKPEYRLGDNVFMAVSNLKQNEVGKILIVTPKGDTYDTIPFNGTMKSDFHYYFKPDTQKVLKLCTPQDLVGNWALIFQGVPYKPIKFNITNEWVQGSQAEIKPIDNC